MSSLMLYHHPLSVCSMKVRLALEEKGLAWSGRVMDIMREQEQLDPWYLKLNPKGVIPTLTRHNNSTEVIIDSATIIRFIAAHAEGPSLLPDSNSEQQLMEHLIDLADGIDLQILSYARHPSMEKSEKILNRRIDKSRQLAQQYPELKAHYRICAERSENSKTFRVDSEHINAVEQQALQALEAAEKQLLTHRFLVGNDYSLADVIWTVVLARLELLGYASWINGERFPSLTQYYQQVKNRKSFSLAQVQNQWWDK